MKNYAEQRNPKRKKEKRKNERQTTVVPPPQAMSQTLENNYLEKI